MRILAISGSLRAASSNTILLGAAAGLVVWLELVDRLRRTGMSVAEIRRCRRTTVPQIYGPSADEP